MNKPKGNGQLISDIIPRKRVQGQAVDRVADSALTSQTTNKDTLTLQPELHFYSELASPAVATQRVRRSKPKHLDIDKYTEDNQTVLDFLEASSETSVAVLDELSLPVINEDDALYKMDMGEIDGTPHTNHEPVIKMSRLRDQAAAMAVSATESRRQVYATFTSNKNKALDFLKRAISDINDGVRNNVYVRHINVRRALWPATIVVFGLVLYFAAYRPYMNHQKQAAAQSLEWKKDQAQWQCTLNNYLHPQAINKEKSCVNK